MRGAGFCPDQDVLWRPLRMAVLQEYPLSLSQGIFDVTRQEQRGILWCPECKCCQRVLVFSFRSVPRTKKIATIPGSPVWPLTCCCKRIHTGFHCRVQEVLRPWSASVASVRNASVISGLTGFSGAVLFTFSRWFVARHIETWWFFSSIDYRLTPSVSVVRCHWYWWRYAEQMASPEVHGVFIPSFVVLLYRSYRSI